MRIITHLPTSLPSPTKEREANGCNCFSSRDLATHDVYLYKTVPFGPKELSLSSLLLEKISFRKDVKSHTNLPSHHHIIDSPIMKAKGR
jgi:hypothetical protein